MKEDSEHNFLGTVLKDQNIKLEGPLSTENLDKKIKSEKGTSIVVKAPNKGVALLKVLINLINSEKSKPK